MDNRIIVKIASHLEEWETPFVEHAIFGTGDASRIAQSFDEFCRREIGTSISDVLFYQSSMGAVAGLQLTDGRRVVVKAHQPDWAIERLQEIVALQLRVASELALAPDVIVKPAPLGSGFATVEEWVDHGTKRNGHDSATRRALASSLHAIIECLYLSVPSSNLPSSLPTTTLKNLSLWPKPHSKLFDFTATRTGADYIDRVAAAARSRITLVGREVIAHCDWRTEHVRFDGETPVIAFDWDSLWKDREPAIVGAVAHMFCADWSQDEVAQAPTLEEARAFVADYESAAGRSFSKEERALCGAVFAYSIGYTARCSHCSGTDRRNFNGTFEHLIHTEGLRLLAL